MTFDEWYDNDAYRSAHQKANMRRAWEAALKHGQEPKTTHNHPMRKGDVWTVKVKGGTHVSEVVILQVTDTTVVIEDPPKASYNWRRPPRTHPIENLEFLSLVCRNLQ